MPIITALQKLRQENPKFKTVLAWILRTGYKLELSGKRTQLRKCFHPAPCRQVSRALPWLMTDLEGPSSMRVVASSQGKTVLRSIRKQTEQAVRSKSISSIASRLLLYLVPALDLRLSEPRTLRNEPFPPQGAFGYEVLSQQQKVNRH